MPAPDWRLCKWLGSLGAAKSDPQENSSVAGALAKALLSTVQSDESPGGADERLFARELREGGRERILAALRESSALEALADVIYNGLQVASLGGGDEAVGGVVGSALRLASDANWRQRKAALAKLSKLEPAMLDPHACEIAKLLSDPEWEVRFSAAHVLGRLSAAALTDRASLTHCDLERPIAEAVGKLVDPDVYVRIAAVTCLEKLQPEELSVRARPQLLDEPHAPCSLLPAVAAPLLLLAGYRACPLLRLV